jgi:hypothetical protein
LADNRSTKYLTIKPIGVRVKVNFLLYKENKKYGGEIQYQIVNPEKTTVLVRPTSSLSLSHLTTTLTYSYYFKTERTRFWILTAIPLLLYLIGSGLIFSIPSDSPYKFYLRIIHRAGNIGNSLLFGLIFIMC